MLPKIEHPTFKITIPSNNKQILLRPMLVKEEKILLMAKESKENNAIMLAVKQVVNNCIVTPGVDLNKLTLFDLDFLFINIRANSIDNIIKISYNDDNDEEIVLKDGTKTKKSYDFEIDLTKVSVDFPKESNKDNLIIKMSKDSGIKLKYPTVELYDSKEIAEAVSPEKVIEELILNCFENYSSGQQVINFKNLSKQEISEFIDNLDLKTYDKVTEFFQNLPKIYYKLEFTNTKGDKREIVLNKLTDFFII